MTGDCFFVFFFYYYYFLLQYTTYNTTLTILTYNLRYLRYYQYSTLLYIYIHTYMTGEFCVFKFLRRSVDGKHLMRFQSETSVFKFFQQRVIGVGLRMIQFLIVASANRTRQFVKIVHRPLVVWISKHCPILESWIDERSILTESLRQKTKHFLMKYTKYTGEKGLALNRAFTKLISQWPRTHCSWF